MPGGPTLSQLSQLLMLHHGVAGAFQGDPHLTIGAEVMLWGSMCNCEFEKLVRTNTSIIVNF